MQTTAPDEHVYRYLRASAARPGPEGIDVTLATSGGCAPNPWLAEGFVAAPQPTARALLWVATIAGSRFWTPPALVAAAIAAADPVVTTSAEAVRFESFSRCCGAYARLDVDAAGLDGAVHRFGTTNIDVNPPLRAALSRIGARDPLRLSIGHDEVAITTVDGQIVQRKVALPERWVRGFAEVAVAVSPLEPAFELRGAGLRTFLEQLPARPTSGATTVVPSGTSARLSSRAGPGGVTGGGFERLRSLRAVAPFVRSLTAFGDRTASPAPGRRAGCTVWCAELDGGRLTLALSPGASRGFSGEGGLLHAAATLDRTTTGHGVDDLRHLEEAGAGRLGYDVSRAEWFARDLPFALDALDRSGGRLEQARRLLESGAVTPSDTGTDAVVTSRGNQYRVRFVDGGWRCTCPWWGRHRDDRGPCKHILATAMAVGGGADEELA